MLHRHGGFACSTSDVFVNVVGGVRIGETAADLALAGGRFELARPAAAGRARGVRRARADGRDPSRAVGEERLVEAQKHGFKRALVPRANVPRRALGIDVVPVDRLTDALAIVRVARRGASKPRTQR